MRLMIDTDAGIDDAQALMLALGHPDVTVEGITTISGNVHVDKVIKNVCTVVDIMGKDVPIYRGVPRPFIEVWEPEAPHIHGHDGMGDWAERPITTRQVESMHAVDALLKAVNDSPGEITLVTLAPLTNVALAQVIDPTFASKVKEVIVMGGATFAVGNAPYIAAEWNLYCDPEAAKIVFDKFPRLTMVTWETTLFNPLPWSAYDMLIGLPTPRAEAFRGITYTYRNFASIIPGLNGYLIPDPLAMAVALDPGTIKESADYNISVELQGKLSRAQTVINYFKGLEDPASKTVRLVTTLHMDGVVDLYKQALG